MGLLSDNYFASKVREFSGSGLRKTDFDLRKTDFVCDPVLYAAGTPGPMAFQLRFPVVDLLCAGGEITCTPTVVASDFVRAW
jgi:hypothetical protein